jgi:hypothetical protein
MARYDLPGYFRPQAIFETDFDRRIPIEIQPSFHRHETMLSAVFSSSTSRLPDNIAWLYLQAH